MRPFLQKLCWKALYLTKCWLASWHARRRDLARFGDAYERFLREIAEHDRWRPQQFADYQTRRLGELIAHAACSIYQACDVFVRPTTSDGDSVALREALHLHKPCVVSDAVPRPEGCQVVATGDLAQYVAQLTATLADLPAATAELKRLQKSLPSPKVHLDVYLSLLAD